MEPLIAATSLKKHYGSTRAVDGVDFTIGPGEVVGLIGPNGAGKSTLLKCVLGLIRYDGDLSVLGQSPRSGRASMLQRLSYIADVASLPEWISVKQLFDFLEGVHSGFDRGLAEKYLKRTEVTLGHKVKALSKGMKTQTHLALIMGIDTRMLVLDEPTLGLDIIFRTEFYDTLANDYCSPDRSILVTTHQVEEIEAYLTRVMFIHHGNILFDMPVADIPARFARLDAGTDQLGRALELKPIHSRQSGDRHVLIYQDPDRAVLESLGDIQTPGLADLFVAKVKGAQDE